MPAKGTETVKVFRPGTRTRTGDATPETLAGTLTHCIILPRSTDETADRGTVIIEGYIVWAPAPVTFEVKATDEIEVRGKRWRIEGVPGDWRSKRGKPLGLMFTVQRLGA